MKRPRSHEIDQQAQNILSSQWPTDWVKREQHPDYGIDYEIQVFKDENPTEIWFRIQLKGKEKYIETHDKIKISFKTDTLDYFINKVPFPVFLFVVQVRKKEVHWIFIQKYVNEILKTNKPEWKKQQTVTIEIPKKNTFYGNQERIEMEAKEGMKYTHRLVFGISDWSLDFKITGALDDIDKFEEKRKLHFKQQNEMDLHLALRYYDFDEKEKSQSMYTEVFKRTKKDTNNIIEHLSSIAGILSFLSPINRDNRSKILELAESGYELAVKTHLKRFIYYFNGIMLETLYYGFHEKITNNQMIQKITNLQGESGQALTSLLSLFQSDDYKYLLDISAKYSQNLYESIDNNEFLVSLDLMIRLIQINLFSYMDSARQQSKDDLRYILENISNMVDNALTLAEKLEHNGLRCEILNHKALLYFVQNNSDYIKILEEMKIIAIKSNLKHYIRLSEEQSKKFKEEEPYPENPSDWEKFRPKKSIEEIPDEEIDELHRDIVKMAGIDLESDDEIANIVKIGLNDRNPGRVLKNCSNIEVAIGSRGIPGIMLGLHTAGSKFLFCKYGTGFYGLSLDVLYKLLKNEYCKGCKHCNPMPKDWKWSLKWQQEKDKKRTPEFQKLIDGFNKNTVQLLK